MKENEELFKKDKNYTLIQRLRRIVIKTGLRKINLSYSRIHLSDICKKLHLENTEDVAAIVAKAIRDGVIDGTIEFEGGFLQSKENLDLYSTDEPSEAFHKRIVFCLDIHNESLKAMRFPAENQKNDKDEQERKERIKQEQIAAEMAEEEMDDDEIDGF